MSLRGVASTKPELEKNEDNPREFISLGVHDPELSLRTVSRRNVKNDIQSGVPRCAGRYKIAGGKLLTVHEQLMHSAGFRGLIWHPKYSVSVLATFSSLPYSVSAKIFGLNFSLEKSIRWQQPFF